MSATTEKPSEAGSTARQVIQEISESHGTVNEQDLAQLPAEIAERVRKAILDKNRMIALPIASLARDVSTNDLSFIHELIRNADESQYTRAQTAGKLPYVAFDIHPNFIIVESNEDGFSHEDVKAICNVGVSTKSWPGSCMRERGTGFKSAFKVAQKVHILSNDFSFYFEHQPGDTGIGMISPIWEEPEGSLPSETTRITLHLHDNVDCAVGTIRDAIIKQLHGLQVATLLFFRALKRVHVRIFDEAGKRTSWTIHLKRACNVSNQVEIKRIHIKNNNVPTEIFFSQFYVHRHITNDVPETEYVAFGKQGGRLQTLTASEIVLAFPLSQDSNPIIGNQDYFAYFPIRKAGFKFLIHADFVLQVNRQDIVTSSARNLALRDRIADAFINAVLQFSEHPTIQYEWMRYLPQCGDYLRDTFWQYLVSHVKDRLTRTPVLRPRSQGSQRLIQDLRILTMGAIDKHGNPLVEDIQPEVYPSRHYSVPDLVLLREYGLSNINMREFAVRVKADLVRPSSKMKSPDTDDDWHSRVARLLLRPFERNWPQDRDHVLELDILPTSGLFRWQAPNMTLTPSHFPDVSGVAIPRDLGWALIDPDAVKNPDRRKLFESLGVRQESFASVRTAILGCYERGVTTEFTLFGKYRTTLTSSKSHLTFLYLSHEEVKWSAADFATLTIFTADNTIALPHSEDVYMLDNDSYSAQDVLKQTAAGDQHGSGAPGLKVPFLHPHYLKDVPTQTRGHMLSWIDWLTDCLRIRRYLRLNGPSGLTDIGEYIAQHRPEKFLGVLKSHWPQWQREDMISAVDRPEYRQKLQEMQVLCEGNALRQMTHAYLPLPELRAKCAEFLGNESSAVPFLKLEEALDESNQADWMFLHSSFGIRVHDDIEMYLDILKAIQESTGDRLPDVTKVIELYRILHTKCQAPDLEERTVNIGILKFYFMTSPLVILPPSDSRRHRWTSLSDCRWDAPVYMLNYYPLGARYESFLKDSKDTFEMLAVFFQQTLDVRSCDWTDFSHELAKLKCEGTTNCARVRNIYTRMCILGQSADEDGIQKSRQDFQNNSLICVQNNGKVKWYRSTDCLWSSAAHIENKVSVDISWAGLETFFVDFLGVAALDIHMVYDDLKWKAESVEASIDQIKQNLRAFNTFLVGTTERLDPEPILKGSLFPVRFLDGHVELCSAETEFAIVDRKHLGDLFDKKAKLLDFSLAEVNELKPFFCWTGLESRYLSAVVKEVTVAAADLRQQSPKHPFKTKAYALSRIAVHFRSPRAQSTGKNIYDLFRATEMYETDRILSQCHLIQDGKQMIAKASLGELHITEEKSTLRIYMSTKPDTQALCYFSKLPRALVAWIMTDPETRAQEDIDPAAASIVKSVLNAPESILEPILQAEGIVGVDFADEVGDEEHDKGVENGVERPTGVQPRTPTRPCITRRSGPAGHTIHVGILNGDQASSQLTPPSSSARSSVSQASPYYSDTTSSIATRSTPSTSNSLANLSIHTAIARIWPDLPQSYYATQAASTPVPIHTGYLQLLNRCILAGSVAELPAYGSHLFLTQGSFDMTELFRALPQDEDPFGSGTLGFMQGEDRPFMLGAAGELYVFRLLSSLALPLFSVENWVSSIRKFVSRTLSNYKHLPELHETEDADIIYHDYSRALTKLLIQKEYLDATIWATQAPKYLIEVKATPKDCDAPFYVSKNQEQRMGRLTNGASGTQNQDTIYVIFRVFNLNNDDIGLKIYVDPERLKQTGELMFTWNRSYKTWEVEPPYYY